VGVRQRPVRHQAAAERPCGRKPSTERSEFRLRVLRAEAAGAGEGGPPPDAGAKAANPLSIGTREASGSEADLSIWGVPEPGHVQLDAERRLEPELADSVTATQRPSIECSRELPASTRHHLCHR
jgi:hypothetical protein